MSLVFNSNSALDLRHSSPTQHALKHVLACYREEFQFQVGVFHLVGKFLTGSNKEELILDYLVTIAFLVLFFFLTFHYVLAAMNKTLQH